jgi:hypothetical protein
MPGLDPGIYPEKIVLPRMMDCRVKPGNDELCSKETGMTAYLISRSLAGLIAIAVWEGLS